MANATPQAAPASSPSSPAPSSIGKIKGALKALFLPARPDPAEAYRARLCAYDRAMFDHFRAFQKSHPDHRVFIGTAQSGKPDVFKAYATLAEAQQAVKSMADHKYGPKPFIALDLRQRFEAQWMKKPDGRDFSQSLKNLSPVSRVEQLVLPTSHLKPL